MKTTSIVGLLVVFTGATGCTTVNPPGELVNARSAYDRASHGPATQLDPADLHTAKESLDVAESSFNNDGATQETRDLAYTAQRRAELAETRARTTQVTQAKDQTVAQMQATQTSQLQTTSAQLNVANRQLATQGEQLANERKNREDADKRAAMATAALAGIGTVKQEARGMVISLSGSVLFASGKSDLLPTAKAKLNDVADALTKQDPDSKMIVEGHTDSQGSATFNQDLSQRRAQSVRDYLVSRGIASDRVTAQGFGATRPIVDNATAEGRADNRRVEIIVKGKD